MKNKTWVASDLHLHHFNVIKYCNRPFKTAEEMNNVLINNWNSLVNDEDDVYYLGDLVIGHQDKIGECVKFDKILKGNKNYLSGNHDKYNGNIFGTRYKNIRVFEIKYESFRIGMSHYPPEENHGYDLFLYGHVHNNSVDIKNSYNCCVEVNDYKPVLLDKIIERIL